MAGGDESPSPRFTSGRRELLAGVTVVSSLAGCLGALGSNRTLGTPVEYRGVKVNPDHYLTARTIYVRGSTNYVKHTAPRGATYLLTHIKSEHVGKNKRVFPIRGSSALSTNIVTKYNAEQLQTPLWESYTKFRIGGPDLTPYMHAVDPAGFYSGRYDGSASGWIVDIIAEGFTPSKTSITIAWGESTHEVNPDNVKSYTWGYTPEGERTPGEM